MTASRDQDVWQYAIDLGYEDCGHQASNGHRKFRHPKTGTVVHAPSSGSDYRSLRNTIQLLRLGAGTSARGRDAVVNARRAKKPKKGANRERLAALKLEQDRRRYEAAAEERYRRELESRVEEIARPVRRAATRVAVVSALREYNYYEGLMRGA